MKRIAFALAFAAQAHAGVPASAETFRGCKGYYMVTNPGSGLGAEYFHTFDGRGRCRGKAWANDCRRMARDFIIDCFGDAWRMRWDQEVLSGDARPGRCLPRGPIGVRNYTLQDLKGAIERAACRLGVDTPARVLVTGMVSGDKGCTTSVEIVRYRITPDMCG